MTRSRALAVATAAGILALLGAGPAAASESQAPGCDIRDATLTWGFKESFRAYIDGDIANGEWTTSDGATYETPEFSWSGGTGRYNSDTGSGSVQFTGSAASNFSDRARRPARHDDQQPGREAVAGRRNADPGCGGAFHGRRPG